MRALRLLLALSAVAALAVPSFFAQPAFAATPHALAFESTFAELGTAPPYGAAVTFDTTLRDTTTGEPQGGLPVQLQSSLDCANWSPVVLASPVATGTYVATAIMPMVAESYYRFVVPATAGLTGAASPAVKMTPLNGFASWMAPDAWMGYPIQITPLTTRLVMSKPNTQFRLRSVLLYQRSFPTMGAVAIVECSADGVSFHRAPGSVAWIEHTFWQSTTQESYKGYAYSSRGTFYRFSATPPGADGPSVSPVVTVIAPRWVFLSASKAKVKAGKPETIHGNFWPEAPVGAKTAQIELRRYNGRKWLYVGVYRPVNTAGKDHSSAYAYTLRLKKRGVYRYRIITPATAYCLRTVSPYKKFTVY
jgi:hypothetical protein